jgi:hypothetical protein
MMLWEVSFEYDRFNEQPYVKNKMIRKSMERVDDQPL